MITLAVTIHNRARSVASALNSWVDTSTQPDLLEIIAVCDGCTDGSAEVVREWAGRLDGPRVTVLETPDIWEIRCNNTAFQVAAGRIMVFAQDDNWMFTHGWDGLVRSILADEAAGILGLLAGLRFDRDGRYRRVEAQTGHKRPIERGVELAAAALIHRVDAVNRPFAIRHALLDEMGGLDEAYCPLEWDETDLSIRLLMAGKANLYLPLDVLNECGRLKTVGREAMTAQFKHGQGIFMARHAEWLRNGFRTTRGIWGEIPDVHTIHDLPSI